MTTMIIDFHTHICDLRTPRSLDRPPLSVDALLRRLDDEGIDLAVVLPWPVSPEAVEFPALFEPGWDVLSQIRVALRHPDRLIAFGNLDARWGGNHPDVDFSWLLSRFVEMGCRGIGEFGPNLPADDPRVVNVVRQCGGLGLPVLIESTGPGLGSYGLVDRAGSPCLEGLLRASPEATVIGHGPGFWADISGDATDDDKLTYPRGAVSPGGAAPRLLRDCTNLYADLSAGSGLNAIMRDPTFGPAFVSTFADKLLFGTDVCFADDAARMPQLQHLRDLRVRGVLSDSQFDAITGGTACRLLGMPGAAEPASQ